LRVFRCRGRSFDARSDCGVVRRLPHFIYSLKTWSRAACSPQLHLSDLYPTLLEAAGIPLPDDTGPYALDGVSFWQALTSGGARGPRTELLHQPVNGHWNASCWACDLVSDNQGSEERGHCIAPATSARSLNLSRSRERERGELRRRAGSRARVFLFKCYSIPVGEPLPAGVRGSAHRVAPQAPARFSRRQPHRRPPNLATHPPAPTGGSASGCTSGCHGRRRLPVHGGAVLPL
jgi:hypothetical protein